MEPRFCPACGRPLEARFLEEEARERLVCSGCGRVHYLNSKPTASVLIEDGARVLLVRRALEPQRGAWDAPGGFLEAGEDPREGVRREVREELGVELGDLELLGVYADLYAGTGVPTLNVYYRGRIRSGRPRAASDVSEWRWFSPQELPSPEETAFQNVRDALADWLKMSTSARGGK